jgi:hypothetical protein
VKCLSVLIACSSIQRDAVRREGGDEGRKPKRGGRDTQTPIFDIYQLIGVGIQEFPWLKPHLYAKLNNFLISRGGLK